MLNLIPQPVSILPAQGEFILSDSTSVQTDISNEEVKVSRAIFVERSCIMPREGKTL